ncbi:regulator of G-protein signaling 2-like isoform X2 [Portunus trituberculatus]|uniref:regulator of G-protein signaling 2-like isoform X2 n=1 Tax=Portunus trituberculatus TaxID=210409 RepID=UPI001E1CEC26|nr:regulator of G-protein signaling 2-like isoform X2 [Portunus trituberculatus]
MSLRKSLRRSLRSSHKVKSSDEAQVKGDAAVPAKASTNERTRRSDAYLTVDDVAVPSGGVTLEAANSSFESHDDVVAAGAYQSSGSEEDLPGERQDEAACPDSALYEFIFRACALMALENDEFKQLIEQQQPPPPPPPPPPHPSHQQRPSLEDKRDDEEEDDDDDEEEGAVLGAEGGRKKKKKGSSAVSDEDEGGVRKKLNDMRLRLSWLRRRGDSQGSVRPMPEEVQGWAESFHNLMASKYGQALFKAFLQREFSEENVEFWLAVEDFKKTRAAKMPSKASKIHSDYVAVQAPKEINLDPGTRAQIAKSLDCPDKYIFDAAQKRVQALMESDAYLRFLQSELYKELLHPDSSLSNPEAL